MLTEICADLRNYFCEDSDKHLGNFEISGGKIGPSDFLKENQYYRIVGSTFNDGVYRFGHDTLTDESFSGAVWAMRVPPSVIALAAEIEEFNSKNKPNGIVSESFGGYSYSKATGKQGGTLTWKEQFADRLSEWRKL